jgi:SAM-dependent methyltransferase
MIHSLPRGADDGGDSADGQRGALGSPLGRQGGRLGRNEEQQTPTYEEAIRRVGIEAGKRVLDIGCGTGVFLRLAAERGAKPFGLDASETLLEIARSHLPDADLRLGEMQALPYEDDTFDLVTGFNSFFFATDLVEALREAGRVAKPGAPVVIQVWGAPERNDLEAMKVVVRPYMPAPPPDAPSPPPLWKPGVLEEIATAAGLTPETAFDTSWAYEYADQDALGRAMVSPAGIAELVGPEREAEVRAEIVEALSPYRTAEGGYRLENEFHFLVARA